MKKYAAKSISLILIQLLLFTSIFVFDASALKKPSDGSFDIFDGELPEISSVTITYECCDICGYKKDVTYNQGRSIVASYDGYCNNNTTAFISWVTENGEEYLSGDTLPFESLTLKAKKIPLLLESDEVLSFSNSDRYFHTDEFDGYYTSDNDYKMMKRNVNRVFGLLSPVAVMLNTVFSTYNSWEWKGSCYGMSTLAFLQHYGVTDVLKDRSDAKCIADLPNSAEVASKINYYQWSAAGSFLCENFSQKKGSKMYSQQLKDVYSSVADGNIVLFTYYPENIFTSSGHTVLLTGAYTQSDGTKVLVCYDCNYPRDYLEGDFKQRFYISEDFTELRRGYSYPVYSSQEIGSFNWTDDYTHFEPFDINDGGKTAPWYKEFFSQLSKFTNTTFKLTFGI